MTKNFNEIESRNTVVFAISTHDLTNATSVAERTGVRFPILYNSSGDVVKQYEVFNLPRGNLPTPSTFIIDGPSVIRYKYVGCGISDRPSASTIIQLLDRFNGWRPARTFGLGLSSLAFDLLQHGRREREHPATVHDDIASERRRHSDDYLRLD